MYTRSERANRVLAWILAGIALAALPDPAWGDEAAGEGQVEAAPVAVAPYVPTPAGGQPIVTVHVFDDGVSGKVVSDTLAVFDEVLGKDTLVRYRDLAELLDPIDEAKAAIADAGNMLKEAQQAFDQMDLETARTRAEGAIRIYERRLHQLGAEEGGVGRLRDAWIRLAAIRFFDGNNDGARDALRRVFVLDPKIEYSGKLFPPQMKKAVVESRLLFDALGSGKLNIESEPPGAMVFVNGAVRGVSPMVIEDAPAGPDYVSLGRRGFAPMTVVVEVNGGGDEAKTEQTLTRFDNDPIGPLGAVKAELGKEEAPAAVLESASKLRVDLLVLVTVTREAGASHVAAYLYDQRTRRLLRQAQASGETSDAGRQVAIELMNQVRLDGIYVPPPPPKVESVWERLTGRLASALHGWRDSKAFWPSVGAAAAVVVVGVAVGVGVGVGMRAQHAGGGLTPGEEIILLGTGR